MKERVLKGLKWAWEHLVDFAENSVRDLKSLRAVWNWLVLGLYVWLVVYLVRRTPFEDAQALAAWIKLLIAIVVTTGGMVTAVFTNYVWSTHKEKEMNRETVIVEEEIEEED